MTPIETHGLDHVDLTVNDVARSEAFYEKVLEMLGFRRVPGKPVPIWASPRLSIALKAAHEAERGAVFNRYRVGLHHLAFSAAQREDVARFHDWLVAEGLPVLDPPADYPRYGPGYHAVFFADPDGMKLELVHFPGGDWAQLQGPAADEP